MWFLIGLYIIYMIIITKDNTNIDIYKIEIYRERYRYKNIKTIIYIDKEIDRYIYIRR
jgi:hypothetical protein